MKRLWMFVMSFVMVFSFFEMPSVFAAVTDDATDGILEW